MSGTILGTLRSKEVEGYGEFFHSELETMNIVLLQEMLIIPLLYMLEVCAVVDSLVVEVVVEH